MALPVAHIAVAQGFTGSRRLWVIAAAGILAVAADFDFALVWGWGLPLRTFHRTWSHSLIFGLACGLVWKLVRPVRLSELTPAQVSGLWLTHILVDLGCTADAFDHGLMLFWPFHEARFGWPVLVPLYRLVGETPFTLDGALRFSLIEVALAYPLWLFGRLLGRGLERFSQG